MNFRTIKTILAKELLDMFRDRRTLLLMIGIPVLLYPALFLFASQAAIVVLDKMERTSSRVAVVGEMDPTLETWLSAIPKIELETSDAPEQGLSDGTLDAVVVAGTGIADALAEGRATQIALRYDATEPRSAKAKTRLTAGLAKKRDELLEGRLAAIELSTEYINPIKIEAENVASAAKTTGALLGGILPVLLLVTFALGAFYPAIDLTAGEKERGTFETLLSTPTSKLEIVVGKFLTVLCLSLCAALLNVVSMALTVAFQLAQFSDRALPFDIHLPPHTVVLFLLVLAPLAVFVSALMMAVAMFARNLKEAEYYITPLLLVLIFPGILAGVPGVELTAFTQFMPVVNVALLFKTLMTGTAEVQYVFAVLLSTGTYAVLALLFATWVFQREDLVLSEERGIPLSWRRSVFTPRSAPTPAMALTMFACVLLLIFYAGTAVQLKWLFAGLLITEWGLILVPTVFVLWYTRIDLIGALNLRRPSADALAGAVFLGGGWVFLIIQVSFWHNKVLPAPEELAREMERLFQTDHVVGGLAGLLFVVALSPAVCEELLFRGAITSGLRQRLPGWATVLVVGALFGAFHLSIYRLVPTALGGFVLTYVVLRSGSLWAGMIMHFLMNAFGVIVATNSLPARVMLFFDERTIETSGLPGWLLACAVLMCVAGVVLLEGASRHRRT